MFDWTYYGNVIYENYGASYYKQNLEEEQDH